MTNFITINNPYGSAYFGEVTGFNGSVQTTCFGITVQEDEEANGLSLVFETPKYIRLSGKRLYVDTDKPEDQHGIYARFA